MKKTKERNKLNVGAFYLRGITPQHKREALVEDTKK